MFRLNDARQNLTGTPAFVDRNPSDDRGMIVVSRNHLLPLLRKTLYILLTKIVGICHFPPDDEPHPVAPVEPARIFNLLMLASAVQSKGLRHLNVVLNRLVGWWRQQAVWPVALIKHQLQVVRRVVQIEFARMGAHLSLTKVTVHFVENFAA